MRGGQLARCLTTRTRIDAETETLIPTIGGGFVDVTSTLDASYGRLQGCSGQDANHGHSHLVPTVAAPVLRSVERPRGDGLDSLIAFSVKDYGGDAMIDCAPTLRAGNHTSSHANGGQPPAIAFQGRGSNVDLGQDVYGTLTKNCGEASGGAPCIAFDARQDPVSSTDVFGALGASSPQAQAVAFCQNTRDEVRLMNGDGQIVGALAAQAGMKQTCYVATCITGDVTHTLKAEGFDASEDGTGRGQPIVAAFQSSQSGVRLGDTHATLDANNGPRRHNGALVGMAVRRLTPRECERLQAFPDDYTLIPYGRVVKLEKLERDWIKYLLRGGVMTLQQVCQAAADGPRYKALGNSWAVPNARWIGQRIDKQLRAMSGANSTTTNEKATA